MKLLVGAACVAVIAFVGYFFWGEYQRREEQKIAELRAEKLTCDTMLSDLKANKASQDWRIIHVVKCLEKKHLSDSDFDSDGLRKLLDEAKPLVGKV
ncbi:hypothetical protein QBD01_002349 [Ochrobactrum sp. 19YEA23]|uniref:hypothetical protein n=1 Tax=Ochrobactrum sp. 19YEA23 TaxID=3039854 RepID=UPI0024790DC3|nr:hypothetical protein [Ochrobactrum sp. 19YEA23]